MKSFGTLLIASALAVAPIAPAAAAAPIRQPAISISELSPDRFELVYSGTKFTSRDEVERQLLLSSARLAVGHRKEIFVLLALPGEQPDVHPARPNPGFGAKYGHWQPHWSYYLPEDGWQWWHPEWGAQFWTKDVDPARIERFEVHAMIELGARGSATDNALPFNAGDVVRELGRPSGVGHRPHPQ